MKKIAQEHLPKYTNECLETGFEIKGFKNLNH